MERGARCQTRLLVRPRPRGGRLSALTGVLFREHLGVKVEKVPSLLLLLIQSAPRWTFQLLTGNTSKIVHTIAYLFIPASPCGREPAIRHQSQRAAAPASSAYSDHRGSKEDGSIGGGHAGFRLTRSVLFDHNIQTNKTRNVPAGFALYLHWNRHLVHLKVHSSSVCCFLCSFAAVLAQRNQPLKMTFLYFNPLVVYMNVFSTKRAMKVSKNVCLMCKDFHFELQVKTFGWSPSDHGSSPWKVHKWSESQAASMKDSLCQSRIRK